MLRCLEGERGGEMKEREKGRRLRSARFEDGVEREGERTRGWREEVSVERIRDEVILLI